MYDQLAEDTEFRIDWDRVSPEEWNQASRASVASAQRGGTPDPAPLTAVFRGMTAPREQDISATAQHRHQGRYAKAAAQFTPTPAARQAAPRPHSAGHNPPPPALPQKPTRGRAQGY